MKLTPRIKKAILQSSVINIIFLSIFIGVCIFWVLPNYKDIQSKKIELQSLASDLNSVRKQGISFQDVQRAAIASDDNFVKNLIQNIESDFYLRMFQNTGSEPFLSFLDTIEQDIRSIQASDEYVSKQESISKILPTYSISQEVGIRDFDFSNYLERVFYSFNLIADGEIGIGNIQKVEVFESSQNTNNNKQKTEDNLFYIPLDFSLVGQKKDIFDFIHYFENVGSVDIIDDSLVTYTDRRLNTVLEGDTPGRTYNIYEQQVSDISSISFEDYPDSSSFSTESDLLSRINSGQSRERYSVELELRFYLSGIPNYQLQAFVTDVITSYGDLQSSLTNDSKKYTAQKNNFTLGTELQALSQLQSLESIVESIKPNILALQKSLAQSAEISKVYAEAKEIDEQIERIRREYDTIISFFSK